ncbi:MAG: carboxypeptidase-like regulatory domain-containing protein [Planctomycetota bacterium]
MFGRPDVSTRACALVALIALIGGWLAFEAKLGPVTGDRSVARVEVERPDERMRTPVGLARVPPSTDVRRGRTVEPPAIPAASTLSATAALDSGTEAGAGPEAPRLWTSVVKGAVVDVADGRPIAGALVVAESGAPAAGSAVVRGSGRATTDLEGRYEVELEVVELVPGTVEDWQVRRVDTAPVTLRAELFGWTSVRSAVLPAVSEKDQEAPIELGLGRRAAVDLYVVDGVSGEPAQGVTLELAPLDGERVGAPLAFRRFTADRAGAIRTDELGTGRYAVRAKTPGYRPRPASGGLFEVAPGTVTVQTIEVVRLTVARGRLVDAGTGEGVALASMRVTSGGRTRRFRSDAAGRFSPRFDVGGPTRVEVEAEGYAPYIGSFVLESGSDGGIGRIELQPTGRGDARTKPVQITGWTAAGETGVRVPRARITLSSPDGRKETFRGDLRGAFSPLAWGRGEASVLVEAEGFERFEQKITVDGERESIGLGALRLQARR